MNNYRCDECGKRRANITVVGGRDLCPGCVDRGRELVTVKTRVPRTVADELHEVARRRVTSAAHEFRQAIDTHLLAAREDNPA